MSPYDLMWQFPFDSGTPIGLSSDNGCISDNFVSVTIGGSLISLPCRSNGDNISISILG